jgi:hypothetical protein
LKLKQAKECPWICSTGRRHVKPFTFMDHVSLYIKKIIRLVERESTIAAQLPYLQLFLSLQPAMHVGRTSIHSFALRTAIPHEFSPG